MSEMGKPPKVFDSSVKEKPEVEYETHDVSRGVTAVWLAAAFGVTQQTVRNRLALCQNRKVKGRGLVYNFVEACTYLAPPRALEIEEYLETTSAKDFPMKFQKIYWDTAKRRMEVEQLAGDLWRSDDVGDSFSRVFQAMKASIQLWPDMVNRSVGITGEQRDILIRLCDQLQDEIHSHIKRELKGSFTPPEADAIKDRADGDGSDILESVL